MKKRIYIGKYLLFGILLLAGGISWLVWHFSADKRDEVKIRKVIYALAADLSKNNNESAAVALLKVKNVVNVFTDPVELAMDQYAYGPYDHDRLLSSVGRYRALLEEAEISVQDLQLEIIGDNQARGSFAGRFDGKTKSSMSEVIIKDVDIELVKIKNSWKIRSMRFIGVLH